MSDEKHASDKAPQEGRGQAPSRPARSRGRSTAAKMAEQRNKATEPTQDAGSQPTYPTRVGRLGGGYDNK